MLEWAENRKRLCTWEFIVLEPITCQYKWLRGPTRGRGRNHHVTVRERTRDVIEETIGLVIGVTQGVLLNMTLLATYTSRLFFEYNRYLYWHKCYYIVDLLYFSIVYNFWIYFRTMYNIIFLYLYGIIDPIDILSSLRWDYLHLKVSYDGHVEISGSKLFNNYRIRK